MAAQQELRPPDAEVSVLTARSIASPRILWHSRFFMYSVFSQLFQVVAYGISTLERLTDAHSTRH